MTPVLVLVGPPASGKTTVGTAVAELLDLPFRDTDADVEDVAGRSVPDLFVQYGEPHFRALEEQAVARAMAQHAGVLALGGGACTTAAFGVPARTSASSAWAPGPMTTSYGVGPATVTRLIGRPARRRPARPPRR